MISLEDYFDNLFKTACGWLGWEPEVILTATISQIELAIEGKIDFVKKTNPWGKSEDEKKEDELLEEPSDPEMAMNKLLQMVKRRQETARKDRRRRVKK